MFILWRIYQRMKEGVVYKNVEFLLWEGSGSDMPTPCFFRPTQCFKKTFTEESFISVKFWKFKATIVTGTPVRDHLFVQKRCLDFLNNENLF